MISHQLPETATSDRVPHLHKAMSPNVTGDTV